MSKTQSEKIITPTSEQIAGWKAKHGQVSQLSISRNGKEYNAYLRQPSRQELGYATKLAMTNPLAYNEAILKSCWLAGNDEIISDNGLFLAAGEQLTALIGIAESSLKNL